MPLTEAKRFRACAIPVTTYGVEVEFGREEGLHAWGYFLLLRTSWSLQKPKAYTAYESMVRFAYMMEHIVC